jgi:flagella basal body P-ring formation protein FlgA
MKKLLIGESINSIEAITVESVQNLAIVRAGDCEHVNIFADDNTYQITAFINSLNEPQIRIKKIQF